jgi:hypothetical protein
MDCLPCIARCPSRGYALASAQVDCLFVGLAREGWRSGGRNCDFRDGDVVEFGGVEFCPVIGFIGFMIARFSEKVTGEFV